MPILPDWLVRPKHLGADVMAGVLMGFLAIPQSLGYALLAGVPPIYGLYAAILPAIVYAWFASSTVQAVGPVATTAVMTASALFGVNDGEYIAQAQALALLTGAWLLLFWVAKFERLIHYISPAVNAGFVSGAALLIIISQLQHFIGIKGGSTVRAIVQSLPSAHYHAPTFWLGVVCFVLLLWSKSIKNKRYTPYSRAFVLVISGAAMAWSYAFGGVKTVGALSANAAAITYPIITLHLVIEAFFIAIIGFLSGHAIAQNIATARKQAYLPIKELKALGLANIASAMVGSFAVAGGLSRTSLNISLGAKTQLATLITAITIILWLPFGAIFAYLPKVLLAAIIAASAFFMLDFGTLKRAWHTDKACAWAFLVCFLGVGVFGLSMGLALGVVFRLGIMLWQKQSLAPSLCVYAVNDLTDFSQKTFAKNPAIAMLPNLNFINAHHIKSLDAHTLIVPKKLDFGAQIALNHTQKRIIYADHL